MVWFGSRLRVGEESVWFEYKNQTLVFLSDAVKKAGRNLEPVCGDLIAAPHLELRNFTHRVSQGADHNLGVLELDVDDDNAGALGGGGGRHGQLGSQVHDGDDIAAQVEETHDVGFGFWNAGDVRVFHDFAYSRDGKREIFVAKLKAENLPKRTRGTRHSLCVSAAVAAP